MNVNTSKQDDLTATLATADEATLREIIREAESFLGAQLTAGLASDSRAMTFAGVMAAIASFLIGGIAALLGGKIEIWPYVLPAAALIGALLMSICYALGAARPTSFHYCGNDPAFWADDLAGGYTLTRSLASQAACYSDDIRENAKVLSESHRCLRAAVRWAVGGLFGAVLIGVILGLFWFSDTFGRCKEPCRIETHSCVC